MLLNKLSQNIQKKTLHLTNILFKNFHTHEFSGNVIKNMQKFEFTVELFSDASFSVEYQDFQ